MGAVLLGVILSSIGKFVKVSDVKNFAEGRLGALLKARVHVGEVRVGFLDQISLKGLKINQEVKNKAFYLLDVDKVVFKYNLGRFWQRDFKNPNTVLLDSPQFTLQSASFVSGLQLAKVLKEGSRLTDELEFKEGKVTLQAPWFDAHCDITDIQGKLARIEGGDWRVDLEARVRELFEGSVAVKGTVDLDREKMALQLSLNHLRSARPDFPVKAISGTVMVTADEIHIQKISFEYNRLPVEVSGWIKNFNASPELDIRVGIGRDVLRSVFQVKGGLDGSNLSGNLQLPGKEVPVTGKLTMNGTGFTLENVRVAGFYGSQGQFDFLKGTFHFYLEREKQRIDLGLNLKDWNIGFLTQLDHMPFFGADLITRAHFQLRPDPVLWKKNEWGFNGRIKTDYLILNQAPFPDFEGEFHALPSRLELLDFHWGDGYGLSGTLGLKQPFLLDATFTFKGIQLEELKSLFARPLPENFKGLAEGEVKFKGENWRAEVEGDITVKEGSIGKIDYDRVTLHFYGLPPYLKLKDSRLKKGLRTFYLDGGIDISRPNIFHDVNVASSEKILLWSGKELSTSEKGSAAAKRKMSGVREQEETTVAVGPSFHF